MHVSPYGVVDPFSSLVPSPRSLSLTDSVLGCHDGIVSVPLATATPERTTITAQISSASNVGAGGPSDIGHSGGGYPGSPSTNAEIQRDGGRRGRSSRGGAGGDGDDSPPGSPREGEESDNEQSSRKNNTSALTTTFVSYS